jgi:hypothetical protein
MKKTHKRIVCPVEKKLFDEKNRKKLLRQDFGPTLYTRDCNFITGQSYDRSIYNYNTSAKCFFFTKQEM